jgi:REP element-mobilizing transposase RayT
MERKIKDTPPRLPVVFQSYDPPLCLVTFNTLLRRPLLAGDAVHAAFREYAERGLEFRVATGRYVLMPDHVHVFVRIGRDMTLRRRESGLKQRLGKTLTQLGHKPTTVPPRAAGSTPQSKLESFWQPGFFDHLLRHDESYAEKWDYVWRNPVRAGLVAKPEDWPYQGVVHDRDRVQVGRCGVEPAARPVRPQAERYTFRLANDDDSAFANSVAGSKRTIMTAAKTKACNQVDATGFIRLNALRLKVAAKAHGKKK